jgi:outer membrane protein OmpA-like peptidoglycan-associated protein
MTAKYSAGRILALAAFTMSLAWTAQAQSAGISSGEKLKVEGVIVKCDAESFILRRASNTEITVKHSAKTEIREKKSNPFRRAKVYAADQLTRGLEVEVEGSGDSDGALLAQKIKFTDSNLDVAQTVESRVTPVEGRLGTAETRLSASEERSRQLEENARRMSGQISELDAVSNAARGGAKAAQETADSALAGLQAANDRIGSLDDYEPVHNATVRFRAASARLSDEAKAALDEVATQAKSQKAFVIEVQGFASADGSEDYNRKLSQERAHAVAQYLAEKHDISLRRIMTPFGYGVSHPVADNTTRDGRKENRRVEVKLLVNRAIASPTAVKKADTSESANNGPVR